MSHPPWNESYAAGTAPWDTGEPEPQLIEFVGSGGVMPGRVLEVGCGTGASAVWLARRGFEVIGVDVATLAVERARAKAEGTRCRFEVMDFLVEKPAGEFDFVFDRGCFHVFDEAEERARFAAQVAAALVPSGRWLSLIGSTEGEPRDTGPPRRSARDLALAIEPALEILALTTFEFDAPEDPKKAWRLLARKRELPAQPSTRR